MNLSEIIINKEKDKLRVTVPAGYNKLSCIHLPQDNHDLPLHITVETDAQALFCETNLRSAQIEMLPGAQVNFISTTIPKKKDEQITKKFILHERSIARIFTGLFNDANIEINGIIQGEHAVFANHLLYLGTHKQNNNIKLTAQHQVDNTMSRSIVHGAAFDQTRINFIGNIYIDQAADNTDAHLEHEGLLFGSQARIQALPKLEINTDNVRATHSSAVHNINNEQLFYLQSRGLNGKLAKDMIVAGFLDEMLFIVQEDKMIQKIRDMIQVKLENISYE